MGSPRQVSNRRRRTREGPEPACVQTPFMLLGWHTQEGKDELTCCRGTVQPAWQKPWVRRKGGRAGCPKRVSGRHVVREVRPGNRQGWWKRSKFRWNGRQLTLDKTVGSRVWWHTQDCSGRPASDEGWGSSSKTTPGSLSTGSPAGRAPPHGDGSMYSKANVRAGKVLRHLLRALPSVIVDTEMVLREAVGSVEPVFGKTARGWKGVRPGVRLERRSGEPARSPKNTSRKIVNTPLRRPRNDWNCIRTIISGSQLSNYGAVSDMCEECDTCHDRTGRPVVAGQSNPFFAPSVMKTHIHLTDDPAQQEEDLLRRYRERIEKLSQQDRVSKFCTDARFLTTVEVGQYFMTKDTEELSQFTDSVACREYTLPRDENLSEPKGWIWKNTKIGPVLEVTTSCLQGKYGVEIRIESMNKDHSHSWVRISHGLNKLVTNLNTRSRTTTSRKPQRCSSKTMRWNRMHVLLRADQRLKENHKDVFLPAHPHKLYLLGKELGPILNHKIIRPPIIQCRRNWSIFFVMVVYREKTMEWLNSGD